VPRFYLDILDDDQVIQDLEGIDFADCETAVAEAVAGALAQTGRDGSHRNYG
jgi:hypothetical protein